MDLWRRLRAAPWLVVAVGTALVGGLLFIGALTITTIGTTSEGLTRAAEQAEILGAALTVAGLVGSAGLWVLKKLRGERAKLSPEEILRRRVAAREDDVRSALLAGLIPVNLVYGPYVRGPSASSTGHFGRAGATGLLQRALGGLLQYDTGDLDDGPGKTAGGELLQIGDYLAGLEIKRLVVLGEPGAGKTVLAIELVLQLLRRAEENPDTDVLAGRVPVRFSAASWLPGQDLRQWLAQRLVLDYGLAPVTARDLVDARRVMPVVDGLDEMDPDSVGTPERALALLNELNSYSEIGSLAPVVVMCRLARYSQITNAGNALAGAHTVTIRDLNVVQLRDYLDARYADNPRMRGRWDNVLDWISEPSGLITRRVLATPWRLLLAVTAAEGGSDPSKLLTARIGEHAATAERRITQTLLACYVPASTRLRARAGRRARHYRPERVERWMRSLAAHLAWQAEQARPLNKPPVGMTGVDIVPHLLWPVSGLKLVRFLHIAFGLLISGVAGALIDYIGIGPPSMWHNTFTGFNALAILDMILVIVAPAAVVAFVMASSVRPWPTPAASARIAPGLVIGVITVIMISLSGIFWDLALGKFVFGIPQILADGLLGGVAAGVFAASWFARNSWLPDAPLASPMRALVNARTTALVAGFTTGASF